MSSPTRILRGAETEICRPWLRHVLTQPDWAAFIDAAAAQSWQLLAHWADAGFVHAMVLDPDSIAIVPVSTAVAEGRYPALSASMHGAALYERMVRDLWGHEADGGTDARPWLNHGKWPDLQPMSPRPIPARPEPLFSGQCEQDRDMTLNFGPLGNGIGEAAHLRLTLNGPVIRRAESRLGFTHKGTVSLMQGKPARTAARFAARLSGDATVAHALAFARAAEAATDTEPPPRAVALRVVMLEIERIAGHLDMLAETARLAEAPRAAAPCGFLREMLLRASDVAFGHRLMMDGVVPGGVAINTVGSGLDGLRQALDAVSVWTPDLHRRFGQPALAARLGNAGFLDPWLAAAFAAGGPAGRAAGRGFDTRSLFMPDYAAWPPAPSPGFGGDAAGRMAQRLFEIEDSLRLAGAVLGALPGGPVSVVLPNVSGEGIACAESIRGDVWHWLRLDHGHVTACFPRDPGWALWPMAECVLADAQASDAGLIMTSFGLPVSGMDL